MQVTLRRLQLSLAALLITHALGGALAVELEEAADGQQHIHAMQAQGGRHVHAGVKVFYHVAALRHYKAIVMEHMSRLHFSGLYERVQGVYCFILGESEAGIREATQVLQSFGGKITIAGTSLDVSQFERFTLLGMRQLIEPTDRFLYMHSKGTQHDVSDLNIYWWSFCMQYFLIGHADKALDLLDAGHDVVGIDWIAHMEGGAWHSHFSGNMWWSKGSYYLGLNDTYIGPAYTDPEFFIGSGDPKAASLWQTSNDMYQTAYFPSIYVDTLAWRTPQ